MSDENFSDLMDEKYRKLKQTYPSQLAKKIFHAEARPVKILRKYYRGKKYNIAKKSCQILSAAYPERDKPNGWIDFNKRKAQVQSFDLNEASLLDDPIKAFQILADISKAESTAPGIAINYRDGICADIAPILIFRLMHHNFPKPMNGFVGGIITDVYEDSGIRSLYIEALVLLFHVRCAASEFAE